MCIRDRGYSEECFVYEPALEKGKTLKDIFANVVEDLKIYRAVYNLSLIHI